MIGAISTSSAHPLLPFVNEEEPQAITLVKKIITEIDLLAKGNSCENILKDLSDLIEKIKPIVDRKTLLQLSDFGKICYDKINNFDEDDDDNVDARPMLNLAMEIRCAIASKIVQLPDPQPDEEKKLLEEIIALIKDILPKINQFSLDPFSEINQKLEALQDDVAKLPDQVKNEIQGLIDEFNVIKASMQQMQNKERTTKEGYFEACLIDYLRGNDIINTLMHALGELNWGSSADDFVVKYMIPILKDYPLDRVRLFVEKIAEGDEKIGVQGNQPLAQRIHASGLDELLNKVPVKVPDVIWGPYFGVRDVDIPPLPAGMDSLLESPCPIYPNKKVKDTHVLRLMLQETALGAPLTLNRFQLLINKTRKDKDPIQYDVYDQEIQQQYGDEPCPQSQWILITLELIPETQFQNFKEQVECVQRYFLNGIQYTLPTLLEAVVCSVTENVSVGTFLYPHSATHCQNRVMKNGVEAGSCVGQHVGNGFVIAVDTTDSYHNPAIGAAGVVRF